MSVMSVEKSPDHFDRGFLLPFYDICNIGEPVLFSISQVDANRKFWQIYGDLNYCDTIYISVV